MKKVLLAIAVLLLTAYLLLWPVPANPLAWEAPDNQGFIGAFASNSAL